MNLSRQRSHPRHDDGSDVGGNGGGGEVEGSGEGGGERDVGDQGGGEDEGSGGIKVYERSLCKTVHLTRELFSCLSALIMMSHTTLAQVFVRVIHVSCACVFDLSSFVSPIFYFILLNFDFHPFLFSMCMLPQQDPLCTSPNEESGPLANNAPLTLCEMRVEATAGKW